MHKNNYKSKINNLKLSFCDLTSNEFKILK